MVAQPNPKDTFAIPGSSIQAEIRKPPVINRNKTLPSLFTTSTSLIDWHLSQSINTQAEPKYATSSSVSYLAGGSVSVKQSTGELVVTPKNNAVNTPLFSISPKNSQTWSSQKKTTLGSTFIDTIDGYILNPLLTNTPSTPFSPVKGWVSNFFPAMLGEGLLTLTVIELIQQLLLSQLGANKTVTNTKEKIIKKDLGTIIVENSDTYF